MATTQNIFSYINFYFLSCFRITHGSWLVKMQYFEACAIFLIIIQYRSRFQKWRSLGPKQNGLSCSNPQSIEINVLNQMGVHLLSTYPEYNDPVQSIERTWLSLLPIEIVFCTLLFQFSIVQAKNFQVINLLKLSIFGLCNELNKEMLSVY